MKEFIYFNEIVLTPSACPDTKTEIICLLKCQSVSIEGNHWNLNISNWAPEVGTKNII